jgi:hypothetical protein
MAREAEISYDAHQATLIKDIAMMFVWPSLFHNC